MVWVKVPTVTGRIFAQSKNAHLLNFVPLQRCRGAVTQSVKRPSKDPGHGVTLLMRCGFEPQPRHYVVGKILAVSSLGKK